MKKLLYVFLLLISINVSAQIFDKKFVIEGHRGARGHLPENTIPSFIKALELGADVLALDVVISGDNKIVVSHESWFSHAISLDRNGKPSACRRRRC